MTWQNKDWLDQPAHLAVGLIGTYGICLYFSWIMWIEAAALVMVGAFVRELMQHEWECSRVGILDLSFFATGAAQAAFFI